MNSVYASWESRILLFCMVVSVLQRGERLLKSRSGEVCPSWDYRVQLVQMEQFLLQEDGRWKLLSG